MGVWDMEDATMKNFLFKTTPAQLCAYLPQYNA